MSGAWMWRASASLPRFDYGTTKSMENYSRRFLITYPNEELPAARPPQDHGAL